MIEVKEQGEDTYFSRSKCVGRLVKEWVRHNSLQVAVDFDDTLFDFHSIGSSHSKVIELLKEGAELNFEYTIYTASSPDRFEFMYKHFFEKTGVKALRINENRPGLAFGNWGKIYYNILLDDRAGLKEAYETLKETIHLIKLYKEHDSGSSI